MFILTRLLLVVCISTNFVQPESFGGQQETSIVEGDNGNLYSISGSQSATGGHRGGQYAGDVVDKGKVVLTAPRQLVVNTDDDAKTVSAGRQRTPNEARAGKVGDEFEAKKGAHKATAELEGATHAEGVYNKGSQKYEADLQKGKKAADVQFNRQKANAKIVGDNAVANGPAGEAKITNIDQKQGLVASGPRGEKLDIDVVPAGAGEQAVVQGRRVDAEADFKEFRDGDGEVHVTDNNSGKQGHVEIDGDRDRVEMGGSLLGRYQTMAMNYDGVIERDCQGGLEWSESNGFELYEDEITVTARGVDSRPDEKAWEWPTCLDIKIPIRVPAGEVIDDLAISADIFVPGAGQLICADYKCGRQHCFYPDLCDFSAPPLARNAKQQKQITGNHHTNRWLAEASEHNACNEPILFDRKLNLVVKFCPPDETEGEFNDKMKYNLAHFAREGDIEVMIKLYKETLNRKSRCGLKPQGFKVVGCRLAQIFYTVEAFGLENVEAKFRSTFCQFGSQGFGSLLVNKQTQGCRTQGGKGDKDGSVSPPERSDESQEPTGLLSGLFNMKSEESSSEESKEGLFGGFFGRNDQSSDSDNDDRPGIGGLLGNILKNNNGADDRRPPRPERPDRPARPVFGLRTATG